MITGVYSPVVWSGYAWGTRVKGKTGIRWDMAHTLNSSRDLKPVLKVTATPIIRGNKFVCSECCWHGFSSNILWALNPFCEEQDIAGCPSCKDINTLVRACDQPGCWEPTSCGYPTDHGYRITCHGHYRP